MKKILLLAMTISFLFSNTEIHKVKDFKEKKEIVLNKSFLQDVKTKIDKTWNIFVKEPGTAKIDLIIDSKKGKIEKVVIISKAGNKQFKIEFKQFLKNLRAVRFKQIMTKNGIIEIVFSLQQTKISKNTWNKISIYKNISNKMYNNYLDFLRKEKNYSNKQIKTMLDSDKMTVTKMMLMALFYDYNKDDVKEAKKYYDIVIKTKINRFVNNTEGLFLADYLLRSGNDKLVIEVLPKFSCQFMEEKKKNECYYFRSRSLYNLNDVSYEIPLNLVRTKIKQADVLYKEIKAKGRI